MSERPILERSINTERALTLPRPRLRGRSHLLAALVTVPGSLVWIVQAPAGSRLGIAAFGIGMAAMFTCSALLHLKRWDARTYERLFRLDHSGIYLAIGGTGIALALLGLEDWPRAVLVVGMGLGSLLGIVVEWLPFAPPRGFNHAVYLTLGWLPVILLPWLWMATGTVTIALLLAGGILYTVGAVVVGTRRPDPWPTVFGYHEIFHLFVIAAVVVHAIMLARLLPA
ncbi:MAG: PAQR family membrane homeostasis protein TrhA [Nitriliruptoraceae bacterium]